MPKISCYSLNGQGGPHEAILNAGGFEVVYAPKGAKLYQEDDLIAALKDSVAVVAGSEPYTPRVLKANPQLRVIARTGVGFDAVDVPTCDEMGIVVCTTPGVNHHAVAEQTIASLMAIARGFPTLDLECRRNQWTRIARPRVMGCTLGIVGLGRIGRAVATRAKGLGLKLLTFDPYASKEFCEQWDIEQVSLDDLLGRSDYVTLHCPATKETKHLINATSLAKMKSGSVLINTARGALVDETALVAALKSGHIRGAGLDVFEVEPLPADSPLLKLENVLLSGHIAGLDIESHHDTFKMSAESILSLYTGGWPPDCVRNLVGVKGWKW